MTKILKPDFTSCNWLVEKNQVFLEQLLPLLDGDKIFATPKIYAILQLTFECRKTDEGYSIRDIPMERTHSETSDNEYVICGEDTIFIDWDILYKN
jgi:hypothetical protein